VASIDRIEVVAGELAPRLRNAGVTTTHTLLRLASTRRGRRDLAQRCRIDEARILRMVNFADLMRINGIGHQHAELLETAGVDSVPELAQRNAQNLRQRLLEANARLNLVRQVASVARIGEWIEKAASMNGVVRH